MFCTVRDGMTGAGVRVGYVQAHVYFRDSFFLTSSIIIIILRMESITETGKLMTMKKRLLSLRTHKFTFMYCFQLWNDYK